MNAETSKVESNSAHINAIVTDSNDPDQSTACPYAIREQYLSHERSIKTIGWFNIVGGSLFALLGILVLAVSVLASEGTGPQPGEPGLVMAIPFMLCGGVSLWLGIALIQLKSWARIALGILYIPQLLFIPVGTIIAGLFIWNLLHRKGAYICSDEYRQIVAATTDLKWYRRYGARTQSTAENGAVPMKRAA